MNRKVILLLLTVLISSIMVLQAACTKSADSSWVDRYNHGVTFLERGEYKNAITEFEAVLRVDPTNFEAKKNLAGAYLEDGNYQLARSTYLEARELCPEDPSIYVNLAHVYHQLGELQLAWDNIQLAREIDPNYPLTNYRAGELFEAQGMTDSAIAAYNDYIHLEPDTRFAQNAQTSIYTLTTGAEQPEEDDADEVEGDEDEEESEGDEELEEEEDEEDEEDVDEEEEDSEDEEDAEGEEEEDSEADEESEDEEADGDDEELDGEDVEGDEEDEEGDEDAEDGEGDEESEDGDEETEGEDAEDEESEDEVIVSGPMLTGDDLYQDRLSRGRQMRAIGSTSAAIRLLLEAYEVHPDYAVVNYELGMAYLLDGQSVLGTEYLVTYLELETDPERRAEVEARLEAIGQTVPEPSEETGTPSEEEEPAEDEPEEEEPAEEDEPAEESAEEEDEGEDSSTIF